MERKPDNHFNQLSPAEAERLALLSEECGEVIQAIGKILRHGYESAFPENGPTNRCRLEAELGDVLAAISLLTAKDLRAEAIETFKGSKLQRVTPYLHHQ
jgi:NTP pyrophosphatase (non-canonical NTP hydrolase)